MKQRAIERTHLAAILVFLGAYVVAHAFCVWSGGEETGEVRPEFIVSSILLASGGFAHACYLLGWRRALAFLGIAVTVSYGAELYFVNVGYGGAFSYTGVLGPKLPGGVPAVIPLVWFMMTYPAYVMANLILDGRLTYESYEPWRLVWLSFLTAVLHTGWDLSRNPTMSGKFHAWIWADGGPYFGVPYANYWGWIVVTFVVVLLYRWVEQRIPHRPLGTITAMVALLPVVLYGLQMVIDTAGGYPIAVRLIAPFAMGIPVFLALDALLDGKAPWRAYAAAVIIDDPDRGEEDPR